VKIQSKLLSDFWGRPTYLGAHVLLPEGFDTHPGARYPLAVFHGHFPHTFGGWRETPPDPNVPCVYSERFSLDCYNRIEDQAAFQLYRDWTGPDFPRVLAIEIAHATPYYDDSYAVNSANNGPYGDAIIQELVAAVEERFRVIREPWARKLSGGSTGGWEALALQIFHPDFFGGTWASCPDSVDFRAHQIVNIYSDDNAYFIERPWTKVERPNQRTPDGNITSMMKDENWFELVSGDRSLPGGQWDIWEATFSPAGRDGYPAPIWDKRTGKIDRQVAAYWKEHYDLRAILERDWKTLGPQLVGKLNIYVGDDDSFYLDNGVELMEKFLESTKTPYYAGSVTYKRGAPHCWGPSSKELLDAMARHIERWAPVGADITSWRYK
jgi:hypothetical protein